MQIEHCLDVTKSLIYPSNTHKKQLPRKLHVALTFDVGVESDLLKPIIDSFANDTE
jgi:hypothetical protein